MKHLPEFTMRCEEIPITPGIASCLNELFQALAMIQSGEIPMANKGFIEGLAALAGLFTGSPNAAGGTSWSAKYYPSSSGNGGLLKLTEPAASQSLVVSRDRHGALYNGIWSRLDENNWAILLFEVVQSPSGYQLEVKGGEIECSLPLGESLPGFIWATSRDVLNFVPEWLAGNADALPPSEKQQPAQPSPRSESPAVLISQRVVIPPQPMCTNCGAPLLPEMRFCGQCAKPVNGAPAQVTLPPPSPRPTPDFYLMDKTTGRLFPLVKRLTIGRNPDNDLKPDDPLLSRQHAILEPVASGWQITDLNSTNGVYVNGERIIKPTPIHPNDEIKVGATYFLVKST